MDGLEHFRTWLDSGVLSVVATVVVAVLAAAVVVRLLKRFISRHVEDSATRYRANKTVSVVAWAVMLVFFVGQLGGRFSGLTVALGAASAGIAFALQEVIASLAGWIAISAGGFYRAGDRVQLGGIKGDVIDIGFIRTTLMEIGGWVNGDLYNGRMVRVANSFVFKEPVFNYSAEFPFVWDEIVVPVKYGCDVDVTTALLAESAEAVVGDFARSAEKDWHHLVERFRIEPARTTPMVTLVGTDNWLEFTVRYPVDHRQRRTTKDALFRHVLKAIDATGGEVALASATFQLVDPPPLSITVQRPPRT